MTTFKDYPYWSAESLDDLREQLRQICNTRKDDITQIANLGNVFVSGRRTRRIPTGSADVQATDRVGDFTIDTDYAYFLINDAGSAVWRRASLGSW